MKSNLSLIPVLLCVLGACSRPSASRDLVPPEIIGLGEDTAPLNCQHFTRGDVIPFAYAFRDDIELGAFNLEIHNNFDHHTHSTEAEDCEEDHDHGEGTAGENPWVFNQDYNIPAGQQNYEARVRIAIPYDVDPGEYHFMIRVTDASGWQQIRSVSIYLE
ncbi:MAG: DUF4625 domain-containing protein [Bacteroidales bacterium]|nr:DUF4625 domain-containing protein [Bacteroidales bacterium]